MKTVLAPAYLESCYLALRSRPAAESVLIQIHLVNWVAFMRAGEGDHIERLIAVALQHIENMSLVEVICRSSDTLSALVMVGLPAARCLIDALKPLLPMDPSASGIRPVYTFGVGELQGAGRHHFILALTAAQDQAASQAGASPIDVL